MGCVQAKSGTYSPPQGLNKLKLDGGYVKGGALKDGEDRKASKEGEDDKNGAGVAKKISIVKNDGWPKWLVDNISNDVLATLVPKTADSYEKLAKIGQGTYSNVYKARDRDTGKIVALKKVRFNTSEPESVKFMAREIIILQKLDHPNIIKLEGIATSRMQYSLYLVFDYMHTDLARIISDPDTRLNEPQVKSYMQQLLSGLEHCHERGILHRDIKGSNLLIDKDGVLKIADFGLANFYESKLRIRPLTSRVVTLWYRAPELLLGSSDYGVGIDLWSAGCVLAEMFIGRPIMPGRTEVEQLHRIFKLCGSPTEDYWEKIKPPTTFRPPPHYKPSFKEAFANFPACSFDLLSTLLSLDASFRGTANSARQSQFFISSPLASNLSGLPAVNKEVDLSAQYNDYKKSRKSKQSYLQNREGLGRLISAVQHGIQVQSIQSQETSNSETSSASCKITTNNEESPPHTPSPSFHLNRNRSARTEAHPNALQNIKNFPILFASITETVNHFEDNRLSVMMPLRSRSNLDFRQLDTEKMSKIFGIHHL